MAGCRDAFLNANEWLAELNLRDRKHVRLNSCFMNRAQADEREGSEQATELTGRRLFLQSLGKWSGAAIAAVLGITWLACPPETKAGAWVNRWGGGGGGGWVNRGGGGGGGWINRGGGGGWVNRWGGGGGGWVNRRGGGGGWINRW